MATQMDINEETIEIAGFFKQLRDDFSAEVVTREVADSLANIAGKQLRAVQINFANKVYMQNLERQQVQPKALEDNSERVEQTLIEAAAH